MLLLLLLLLLLSGSRCCCRLTWKSFATLRDPSLNVFGLVSDANGKALHLDTRYRHGHRSKAGSREFAVHRRKVPLDDFGGGGKVALVARNVTARVRLQRSRRVQR